MNSREKGKKAEREIAKLCREEGYPARRGQQFCGLEGSADVVGLPGMYAEVKRRALKTLESWLHKALCESLSAGKEELPVVFHRGDGEDWKVTMYAEHWFLLYKEYEAGRELKRKGVE